MIRLNCLAITLLLVSPSSAGGPVEFNRDIRPILTKHCTACHGGVKEAGEISFIYREKALGAGRVRQDPDRPRQARRVRK